MKKEVIKLWQNTNVVVIDVLDPQGKYYVREVDGSRLGTSNSNKKELLTINYDGTVIWVNIKDKCSMKSSVTDVKKVIHGNISYWCRVYEFDDYKEMMEFLME